jgi:hypothetical protein
VDIHSAVVSCAEATELVQPSQSAFNNPTVDAQSAAVFGIAPSQHRLNPALAELIAVRLRVVATITLDALRSSAWSAAFAWHGSNAIDQRQQLGDVVRVGTGQGNRQRNAVGIGDYMVLAATLAAIRGVRAGFLPPSTALSVALSTIARDQSIWSAWRSFVSKMQCNLSHTPARCQATSRRQQVMPQPQPISNGKASQGMPVRRTNKMPVSAARLLTGGRPPFGDFLSRGMTGSQTHHNSSVTKGLAIAISPSTRKNGRLNQTIQNHQDRFC